MFVFFFFKQKTAYEMRISDWSSDVCSSDLIKEAKSLRGRAAAVAQTLAAWRERKASEVDRPVRYLLADLALVSMAQRPPKDEADLRRVRGLDAGKRQGDRKSVVRERVCQYV